MTIDAHQHDLVRSHSPTQVRFVRRPAGVPDEDTWQFTHDATPDPGEGAFGFTGVRTHVKIVTREHILEGIAQFPSAVRMIFAGRNRGKLLIRL